LAVRCCASGVLLPVELRHANHTASTNGEDSKASELTKPYNSAMASGSPIDPLVERVERLLVRYEELQRTNALLAEQVELLTQERDSLKSRLSAARSRVDALLERLPDLNTPA
jgi:cell division protein ZapB